MAKYIAAGWHRCLDALIKLIDGHPIEWEERAGALREYYGEAFVKNAL
ncbi:hypothetical protein ACFQ3N_13625 [Virgibacillus byunsanensis]|uniref:Uncharacterized protein n=1 Tax=Virgibacillus byunsanensis TaxID=570945 RepID=A0ABW3LNB4_9BACI